MQDNGHLVLIQVELLAVHFLEGIVESARGEVLLDFFLLECICLAGLLLIFRILHF